MITPTIPIRNTADIAPTTMYMIYLMNTIHSIIDTINNKFFMIVLVLVNTPTFFEGHLNLVYHRSH
jgi:hypothetical protein